MNEIDTEFAAFAASALKASARMLDHMTPEAQHGITGALQGGARLVLEFGPLPAFTTLRLVLVEAEGRRHSLGTMSIKTGPVQ